MPRRYRSIWTGTRYTSKRSRRPLRVPQTPDRPLILHQRDLLKTDLTRLPRGLVIHRRGPERLNVGGDPRELRAVPHAQVRGTLPERILYKWLTERKIFFDFQTSLLGGRQELGGLVADFILPDLKIILNPVGPTHDTYLQHRKDNEQRLLLEEMGFTVYFIQDTDVYNEFKFEEIMRAILNLNPHRGSSAFSPHETDSEYTLERLQRMLLHLRDSLERVEAFT